MLKQLIFRPDRDENHLNWFATNILSLTGHGYRG